jgi:SH3-like domain-containing protein
LKKSEIKIERDIDTNYEMETKYGFTKIGLSEFLNWIDEQRVGRTILTIQQHHTFMPSYREFNGSNHFELQKGMKNYHVGQNGFSDIAQHFTIFPDGAILTGRSLDVNPAGIKNRNSGAICIENLGDFDIGQDNMLQEQKDSIVQVTAALCKKFNLVVNSNSIVYHHWFRLSDGFRNDGAGGNKSCPGTNFFGGNKVVNCEANFLPLVNQAIAGHQPITVDTNLLGYAVVTADSLNVRVGPGASNSLAPGRDPVQLGAVLRVYAESDGWLKISNSASHWVSQRFTLEAKRFIVDAGSLNVRFGPGTNHPVVRKLAKDDQVFVLEEEAGWAKIALNSWWVNKIYLREF